jgi:hypothetical protein
MVATLACRADWERASTVKTEELKRIKRIMNRHMAFNLAFFRGGRVKLEMYVPQHYAFTVVILIVYRIGGMTSRSAFCWHSARAIA